MPGRSERGAAMIVTASAGGAFAHLAVAGPLSLAVPVGFLAGLVSFLSPCMLPLVPGYFSYVIGLTGADLDAEGGGLARTAPSAPAQPAPLGLAVAVHATPAAQLARPPRRRLLAASVLFVLGFTAVFVSTGAAFGGVGGPIAGGPVPAALAASRWTSDRSRSGCGCDLLGGGPMGARGRQDRSELPSDLRARTRSSVAGWDGAGW